jgi:toxin ParE1/3/4
VARFRISKPAQSDLRRILTTSAKLWGADGRQRYASLLDAAMRRVADDPKAITTKDRTALHQGIRSLHLRLANVNAAQGKVKDPVHIIYYRPVEPGLVEIIRVLHERMDPSRHIGLDAED